MKKTLAAAAIVLAAAPVPALAQTLLDRAIQRISTRKVTPAAATSAAATPQSGSGVEMAAFPRSGSAFRQARQGPRW